MAMTEPKQAEMEQAKPKRARAKRAKPPEPPPVERKLTEEEFLALPDTGHKVELVDGEVKEVPTGFAHEDIGMNLTALLLAAGVRKYGRLLGSSLGCRMASGNVRAPDVAFLSKARVPKGLERQKFLDGAPDLAVEVISPSEDHTDMMTKVGEYLESGAKQVWQVFPESRRVVVYRSLDQVFTLEAEDDLDGGDLLPGFRCRVADLFSETE